MNTKYTMEELRNSLYSGLICDVLDQMGYRHQFLSNEMALCCRIPSFLAAPLPLLPRRSTRCRRTL